MASSITYKLIRKLPVFGAIFRVANSYAYQGKPEGNSRVAPIALWWSRILNKMLYVLIFVCIVALYSDKQICNWTWEPADTILGAFPSILGFGIGVYALMFIMPSDFLTFLTRQQENGKRRIGPEIVPVDMGFPLIVFVVVMIIGAFNKAFSDSVGWKLVSFWALFYGLAMCVELITFLFNSSQMIQKLRSRKSATRYLRRNSSK